MLELLQPYIWPLFIALGVTIITTPIARVIAIAGKIMDMPNTTLKPHAKPIPYLGGVAIYCGWAAAILTMVLTTPEAHLSADSRRMLWTILAGGTMMMLIGLADDLRDLRPKTKLAMELIVAGVLIYAGIGKDCVVVVYGWFQLHPPAWLVFAASAVMTVVILMGAGNATNLIDGLDGLCSGVTGIIAAGFAIIAAHLAGEKFSLTGDPVRLIVAFSLLGACLGFLRYNFNPAQVFMGDAGSLLLGFNAAIMLLLFAERGILRWFLGACMVFSLPVFDTTLAITRRWLNGKPIFAGDRSHFYDQLRDRGYSVRKTVLICYVLAAAGVGLGCLVLYVQTRYTVVVFLCVVLAAILTAKRLGMLRAGHTQ